MVDRLEKKRLPRSRSRIVEQVDELVLAGTRVQVRALDLPIGEIMLDSTNPRLANTVALNHLPEGPAMQQHLQEILWSDPDVRQLFQSVRENKGLVERIIVRENRIVAEGNCRTVVYRKLHELLPNDPTWRNIPARVLPGDITQKQIDILLGELHVGGKNEWIPFEKAGHIHALFARHGLTQDEIAKLLHTSKTSVNHNIHAFGAMKDRYLVKYPGPGAPRKFSHFLELFKKPTLREWVKNDPTALDKFVKWVGNVAIYLDRTFNLVDYLQSQDRIHRISQTKPCEIVVLVARNTVDEFIDFSLEQKHRLARFAQSDTDTITAKDLALEKPGVLRALLAPGGTMSKRTHGGRTH